MQLVLDDPIAPEQSSFIPGRQTKDNIIVAQELMHTMRKLRDTRGHMAVKDRHREPMTGFAAFAGLS